MLLQENNAGPGSGGAAAAARKLVGLGQERGNSEKYRSDQKRMKRIAEVLSGGKM